MNIKQRFWPPKTIMPPDVKLQEHLAAWRNKLLAAGIETAELDARLLFQAACGFDHAGVILNGDQPLDTTTFSKIEQMMQRRLAHEPVSRILGEREFYGRQFLITKDVLDPRPDTETLIDLALSVFSNYTGRGRKNILDIGTGSGAIIVTLLSELPHATGVATDFSASALEIAKQNSIALGVAARLRLLETSWCKGVDCQFDMIVSNPPYIVTEEIDKLASNVKNFEPSLALDGGKDGLNAYREIAKQAPARLKPGGVILLEIGFDQAETVTDIFLTAGFTHHPNVEMVTKDLGGNDRVVTMLWDN